MPIVIKELFPSDPISEALEKINFNFDQLILAGGGPPGPIGPLGPQGVVGPQGTRGDHWFVGSTFGGLTADHDGASPLQVQDLFLDPIGDVYNYFDISGSTGWTYSGINLRGPSGSVGSTGGSLEWDIYEGIVNSSVAGFNYHYGPAPPSISADTSGLNFIVPIGPTKNSVLIGDPEWFYTKVNKWNNISQWANGGPTGVEGTPRLAIIQRQVDYYGINGFQIGSYGLTGATSTNATPLLPSILPIGATVNAIDFLSIGIGIKQGYSNEFPFGGNTYWSHSGTIKTFTRDLTIEAGDANSPGTRESTLRLGGGALIASTLDNNKWISMGIRHNPNDPTKKTNIVQIGSIVDAGQPSIWGYVNLQGHDDPSLTNVGPVIVGPVNDAIGASTVFYGYTDGIPPRSKASLIISRAVPWGSQVSDASILFVNPTEQTTSNDFVGRITGIQNAGTKAKSTTIASDSVVVTRGIYQLNSNHEGRFPFHVNAGGTAISTTHWPSGSTSSWDTTGSTGFQGWIAGFDKYDAFTFSTTGTPRGLGIGYIGNLLTNRTSKEILLQTYFTQNVPDILDPGGIRRFERSSSAFNSGISTSSGLNPSTLRGAPHMYLQLGDELLHGNVGIGLGPSGINRNAWSKLSVAGSIRVGLAESTTGIHDIDVANTFASGGAFIEGRIIRGVTGGSVPSTWFATLGLTAGQALLMFEGTTAGRGVTGIGLSNVGGAFSDYFIAKQGGTGSTSIAYALSDGRSGMRQGSTAGDAFLSVANSGNYSTINSSTQALNALRFSRNGDFGTPASSTVGIQTQGVRADKPLYLDTTSLLEKAESRAGWVGVGAQGSAGTKYWRYLLKEIQTDSSIIYFDLSSAATVSSQFATGSFNSSAVADPSGGYVTTPIGNAGSFFGPLGVGWDNVRRFTLAPGTYDGQCLTLVFGPVDPQNRFIIYNTGDLPNDPNSSSGLTIDVRDRHRLAATSNDDMNPNESVGGNAFLVTGPAADGRPYPFSIGATSYTGSPDAVHMYSGQLQNWVNLSLFGTVNDVESTGAFAVRSWRTLNLRWLKIRSGSETDPDNYAWVEIGREYLSLSSSNNSVTFDGGSGPVRN